MIAGGYCALVVSDVSKAARFYVETLGFKRRELEPDDGNRIDIDAGGGLVLRLEPAGGEGTPPGARGSVSVGLEVNQPIDEVVQVLANRGVRFLGPVRVEGGWKSACFADPDGNALCLVERGGAPGREAF